MSRKVQCKKLNKELIGLDRPPYPGPIGQKIYENISAEAWQSWLNHQTMLINEYRLNLTDQKSRKFLLEEMEKFLFGDGSNKPAGFTPADEK